MEEEERPTKQRKIHSDHDATEIGAVEPTPWASAQTDSPHAPPANISSSHKSPPTPPINVDPGLSKSDAQSADTPPQQDASMPIPEDDVDIRNGVSTKPLSKNQLKKLKKREEWEASRDYRKAKRKEKLQEKKARKRAARTEGAGPVDQHGTNVEKNGVSDASKTTTPDDVGKHKHRRPVLVPMTILIDCGFDHLMTEKERISLASQITRSYSDNSHARWQAHLVISSWSGHLKHRFDTVLSKHYLNWKGVTFVEGDFVHAARRADEAMKGPEGGKLVGLFVQSASVEHSQVSRQDEVPENGLLNSTVRSSGTEGHHPVVPVDKATELSTPSGPTPAQKPLPPQSASPPTSGEIIYLTSDSPETLSTLSPYSTYIVGGLVDKNRHKGICYKTACDRGIKTAKLPIGEYMDMQSRKVLATNHVVEIMLRYLECGDWGHAFVQVIPKRKGGQLRKGRTAVDHADVGNEEYAEEKEEQDEDDEDHENEDEPPDNQD